MQPGLPTAPAWEARQRGVRFTLYGCQRSMIGRTEPHLKATKIDSKTDSGPISRNVRCSPYSPLGQTKAAAREGVKGQICGFFEHFTLVIRRQASRLVDQCDAFTLFSKRVDALYGLQLAGNRQTVFCCSAY